MNICIMTLSDVTLERENFQWITPKSEKDWKQVFFV